MSIKTTVAGIVIAFFVIVGILIAVGIAIGFAHEAHVEGINAEREKASEESKIYLESQGIGPFN